MRCTNDWIKWFSHFFFLSRRNVFEQWDYKSKAVKIRAPWVKSLNGGQAHSQELPLPLPPTTAVVEGLWKTKPSSLDKAWKSVIKANFPVEKNTNLLNPAILWADCLQGPNLPWLETLYLLSNEKQRRLFVWNIFSVTLPEKMQSDVLVSCISLESFAKC